MMKEKKTIEKPRSKSRSLSKGRTSKKEDAKESKITKEVSYLAPVDAIDADDEGEKTIEKPRSKSRSLSKGRTSKKEDVKEETKDIISLVQEEKVAPTETPKLKKPKR